MSTDAPTTSAPLIGEPLPVEFMNTIWADRTGVHDSLATAAEAGGWITALAPHLGPAALGDHVIKFTAKDVTDLRRLRDAARRLAARRTEDPRERAASAIAEAQDAVATLNACAGHAPSWPVLEFYGKSSFSVRSEATGTSAEALLGFLAAETITLFGQGDSLDLRACLAPGCVLYFVKDHPRREWCSTACGNRARAARHYARHGRTR